MEIKGRDLVAGIPKVIVATSDEMREALVEPIAPDRRDRAPHARAHAARSSRPTSSTAASCWSAAARCCATSTIVLREETKLPILRSEDPFTAVVHGAGRALENLDLLREVALP